MTQTIYNGRDVAQLLQVTPSAVTNYRERHDDTPAPAYETLSGRAYWDEAGMVAWIAWSAARREPQRVTSGMSDRELARLRAIDAMRQKFTS